MAAATASFFCPRQTYLLSSSASQRSRTSVRGRNVIISCDGGKPKIDRREVLIGLGGLYGATSGGLVFPGKTIGAPISAPDITQCGAPDLPNGAVPIDCCPPVNENVVDFVPPPPSRILVRPAAHNMTKEQIEKYEEATRLMKALPDDDPRSFTQQASVHCAYCDGIYDQIGFPGLEIQIHNSWLFFPFHRWELYFYEKILGKLIGDDEFVMPFWNYDHPDGMSMPAIFANTNSPLYDPIRNQEHVPPVIMDLDFNQDVNLTDEERIENNLKIMYRQMVTNSKKPQMFFGEKYVAGDQPNPGAGSFELVPHMPVHGWVGDPRQPNKENMGSLYSAGRDPLFYCHHMNVDRMWDVWRRLSEKNRDPKSPDWLESSFLFYNEDAVPVRVKTKDCLETSMLGYRYESVDLPWLEKKPTPGAKRISSAQKKVIKEPKFPVTLNSVISTTVKRSRKSRSAKEKEEEEEVLVVEGIEFDRGLSLKMDVYVNSPDHESLVPGSSEFAGSFLNIPHKHKHSMSSMNIKTKLTLGLTDLLDDIEADDDDDIVVTLVPRTGKGKIAVSGVSIRYLKDED